MLADELAGEIAFGRRFAEALARPCEVVVYGAGKGGREFLRHCGGIGGVRVVGFVDDDVLKVGTRVEGVEVFGVEKLRGFGGVVVVALAGWEGAERRLRETGVERWVYSADFPVHVAPLPGEAAGMGSDHFDVAELLSAWGEVEWLDTVLADKFSRETLRGILRYRLTRRASCLRKATYGEYRHPLVRAEAGDLVIDAGGFDGDTAGLFLETMGEEGRVHVFEPSRGNMRRLRERAGREGWGGRVVAVEAGVGASDGEAGFVEDAGSPVGSRVAVGSEVRVKMRSLDSYCAEAGIVPTMIKMDVEGFEGAALKGASGVIGRYGPKLQICVYHKAGDLWEIARWVKGVRGGYRFYLGGHAGGDWSDVVLYAR
jgi:FkbM family methyltransferase